MQEDDLGGSGEALRFALPGAASPAPLTFLLASGQELRRAGGHELPAPALRLVAWHLGAAVLDAYRCAAISIHFDV